MAKTCDGMVISDKMGGYGWIRLVLLFYRIWTINRLNAAQLKVAQLVAKSYDVCTAEHFLTVVGRPAAQC